jgi:hypothetical protein
MWMGFKQCHVTILSKTAKGTTRDTSCCAIQGLLLLAALQTAGTALDGQDRETPLSIAVVEDRIACATIRLQSKLHEHSNYTCTASTALLKKHVHHKLSLAAQLQFHPRRWPALGRSELFKIRAAH